MTAEAKLLPVRALIAMIRADADYAWSWHCNIAMAAVDSGVDHDTANESAATFMERMFDVDTRSHPGFDQVRRRAVPEVTP